MRKYLVAAQQCKENVEALERHMGTSVEILGPRGDHHRSLVLKGGTPRHGGALMPDSRPMAPDLHEIAMGRSITPERDLVQVTS